LYWVAGVTAGALAGAALPIPSKGIDFAMTALFLVILTEQCRERANRLPAVVGGVAGVAVFTVLSLAFGAKTARADMLIPTMMLMVTALLVLRRRMERRQG
jgi:4-azaleucine resistance transporter AzlC